MSPKTTFALFCFFFFQSLIFNQQSAILHAQIYQWAHGVGGISSDGSNSIATDSSGNIYITGYFQNTVDFDPGIDTANLTSNAGSFDIFFAKYDSGGNYVWAKSIGSSSLDNSRGIAADAQGNVYITGGFGDTADFDPGIGVANLAVVGVGSDIFFAKYDTDGNYLWANAIGSTSLDVGNDINIDDSGMVYITGYFNDTADFDPGAGIVNLISVGASDIFFGKYDSSGNYLWAKNIDGTSPGNSSSINIDDQGNIYITGDFKDTADFDPGVGTANLMSNSGSYDIFFAKYNNSGNYLWAKSIGGITTDVGRSITTDTSENVYITGYFGDTADFDPGVGISNLISAGFDDIFLAKYDSSGNYLWSQRIGSAGGENSHSIVTDASGMIYMSGSFQNTVDFDPGSGTADLTSVGGIDMFFAKYDSSGSYLWAQSIGSPGWEVSYGMTTDDQGYVYVTGQFSDTTDSNCIAPSLISNGSNDIFFAKYSQSGLAKAFIPDTNFRSFLNTNYPTFMDCSGDSLIIDSAATLTGALNCFFQNIADLTGVEHFVNITYLYCYNNQLIALPDLSNNTALTSLNCNNNQLTVLPALDSLTALNFLNCSNNQLTVLPNLSAATSLSILRCDNNKLDFSDARELRIADTISTLTTFIYSPQNPFGIADTFILNVVDTLILSIASQDSALSYQWFRGTDTITGATDTLLMITNLTLADSGLYTCRSYGTALDTNNMIWGPGITEFVSEPFTVITFCTNLTLSNTDVTCAGGSDGMATATPSGGISPYTYSWSNGDSAATADMLAAGSYFVTVTDSVGCITTGAIAVNDPPGVWTPKADFGGMKRFAATAFSIGGKGYITTGSDSLSIFKQDHWEYDPMSDSWAQKANFLGTPRIGAVSFSIGNKGYVGTGMDTASANTQDFWEYDPGANIWVQKASFPGSARRFSAGFVIGNKGYLGTGYDSSNFAQDFWEYDQVNDNWTQKVAFGGAGRYGATGFAIGGKGYIGTGFDGIFKTDFWEYDPSLDTWTQKADFIGSARDYAVGFSINNKGYIGTGWDLSNLFQDFYKYDPVTNAWMQKPNFGGTPRMLAVGFSIGNRAFIGTGSDTTSGKQKDFWEYSPGLYAIAGANTSICTNDSIILGGIPTASTGTLPYTYSWLPSAGLNDGTIANPTATPTSSTTYILTVTDSNGCIASDTVTITVSVLNTSVSKTDASCSETSDGDATVAPSGGILPYTYAWSNGDNTATADTLMTGIYIVTVTDSIGCTINDSANITAPSALLVNISVAPATCSNTDGSAVATITGGMPPYDVLWTNGSDSTAITGVQGGLYTIDVTDSNGCTNFAQALISNSDGPIITANSVNNVSCPGTGTGSIDIMVTGGIPPYTYNWSNGDSTQDLTNLSAGTYDVIVKDTNNCLATQAFIINDPIALSVASTTVNSTCGIADGSITLSVSGGTPSYAYLWSTGDTTSSVNNVLSGVYTVTVTDSVGCTTTELTSVSDLNGPVVQVDSIVAIICGDSGIIFINTVDSTLTYNWTTGDTTQNLIVLNEGTYGVVVTDTAGCNSIATANVDPVLPPVKPVCLVTVDTANNRNIVVWEKPQSLFIGGFNVYRESSSIPGTYQNVGFVPYDSLSQFTDNVSDAGARWWRYRLSMTDICGEEGPLSDQHKTIHLNIQGIYPDTGQVDSIRLVWSEYSGYVFNYYYIHLYEPVSGWAIIDSVLPGKRTYADTTAPMGVLTYLVEVSYPDSAGCTASKTKNYNSSISNTSLSIFVGPALAANATSSAATFSICNGSATANVTGGTSPYTYLWNDPNSQTNQTADSLCGNTTYTVLVTDANGDTVSTSVLVGELTGINQSAISDLESAIKVYPNPSRGVFTIECQSDEVRCTMTNVRVFDVLGREIYSNVINKDKTEIDLSGSPVGIYHLRVVTDYAIFNRKIVVE